MNLMPFPTSRKLARPLAVFPVCILVVFGAVLFGEGQYFIGLIFFGMAGIFVLGIVVFSMEWFQNLDQSLRIFQAIFIISVVGAAAGLFLHGIEGALFGWIYTFLIAQSAGTVCALYFRHRDQKEEREYETEMRKYGKEP